MYFIGFSSTLVLVLIIIGISLIAISPSCFPFYTLFLSVCLFYSRLNLVFSLYRIIIRCVLQANQELFFSVWVGGGVNICLSYFYHLYLALSDADLCFTFLVLRLNTVLLSVLNLQTFEGRHL